MSEEEKKAIEKVKEAIRIDKEERIVTIYDEKPLFRDQLQALLDLIERQQKEIEEKDKYIKAIADIRIQDCKENYSEVIDKYFISKDKIREKIKERNDYLKEEPMNIEAIETRAKISILEELLKENNAE